MVTGGSRGSERVKVLLMSKKAKKIALIMIPCSLILALGIGLTVYFKKKLHNADFEKALNDSIHLDMEAKASIPAYMTAMNDYCSFDVLSFSKTEMNGSEAYLVKTILTYPDVSEQIRSYLESNSFDKEKVDREIAELVTNASSKTSEHEIYFLSNNEKLTPIFTADILDEMYGGIYSGYSKALDEYAMKYNGGEDGEGDS